MRFTEHAVSYARMDSVFLPQFTVLSPMQFGLARDADRE